MTSEVDECGGAASLEMDTPERNQIGGTPKAKFEVNPFSLLFNSVCFFLRFFHNWVFVAFYIFRQGWILLGFSLHVV